MSWKMFEHGILSNRRLFHLEAGTRRLGQTCGFCFRVERMLDGRLVQKRRFVFAWASISNIFCMILEHSSERLKITSSRVKVFIHIWMVLYIFLGFGPQPLQNVRIKAVETRGTATACLFKFHIHKFQGCNCEPWFPLHFWSLPSQWPQCASIRRFRSESPPQHI